MIHELQALSIQETLWNQWLKIENIEIFQEIWEVGGWTNINRKVPAG